MARPENATESIAADSASLVGLLIGLQIRRMVFTRVCLSLGGPLIAHPV
jgi:hypothetical protein